MKTGQLLAELHEEIPHGDWLGWLQTNVPEISKQTAQRYVRLWEHRDSIKAELAKYITPVTYLPSIREALALIRKPKPRSHSKRPSRNIKTVVVPVPDNLTEVLPTTSPGVEDGPGSSELRRCPMCGHPLDDGAKANP